MSKPTTLILAVVLGVGLAACSNATLSTSAAAHAKPAAVPATTATQASPTASPAAAVAPAANTMSCSTVVDPDANLTASKVIAGLEAMLLIDGVKNLPAGTPSSDDTQILEMGAIDLENYSGNQLATDAENFANDEQDFETAGWDGTDGTAVSKDILVLAKDCHTEKAALKLANG